MTKHLINGKPYSYYEKEKKTELQKIVKGLDVTLEKIIVITSKALTGSVSRYDPATYSSYSDVTDRTGTMVFVADKKKYKRFNKWIKKMEQEHMIDEVYIMDRFHIDGEDMIESVEEKLHEFSYTIELKEKYKHCWWGGEVMGCRLFSEFALDPDNKRW